MTRPLSRTEEPLVFSYLFLFGLLLKAKEKYLFEPGQKKPCNASVTAWGILFSVDQGTPCRQCFAANLTAFQALFACHIVYPFCKTYANLIKSIQT